MVVVKHQAVVLRGSSPGPEDWIQVVWTGQLTDPSRNLRCDPSRVMPKYVPIISRAFSRKLYSPMMRTHVLGTTQVSNLGPLTERSQETVQPHLENSTLAKVHDPRLARRSCTGPQAFLKGLSALLL